MVQILGGGLRPVGKELAIPKAGCPAKQEGRWLGRGSPLTPGAITVNRDGFVRADDVPLDQQVAAPATTRTMYSAAEALLQVASGGAIPLRAAKGVAHDIKTHFIGMNSVDYMARRMMPLLAEFIVEKREMGVEIIPLGNATPHDRWYRL